MTTLLLNEKTIPTLAKGWVAGVNNKGKMQEALIEAFEAVVIHKNIEARNQLVKLWEALEHNKKALASIRAQFNTLSKRVKKANGDLTPLALTVKDGVLVDVTPRNKGGNGGGEGEGDGDAMTSNAAPSNAQIELTAHLEILREMLAKSKDVAATSALKFAIAKLAASL
tara:strand:+ start:459 stop:965 length:507 start_codon:yes stop_codon:yes gene_type:complete